MLVFVVLLLLALTGLGHGMLVLAVGELAASRAAVRQLVGRAAAEGAAAYVLRQPEAGWTDSVPVGGARVVADLDLGRAEGVAAVRRLAPESWLVEGTGRLPGRTPVRSARLAWSMDPLTRVSMLVGTINVAVGTPVTLLGAVDTSAPAGWDAAADSVDCVPWLSELEGHYASSPLATTAVLADTTGGPALGLLGFSSLLASTDVFVTGVGTPAPVEHFGVCATDEPWSLGDPLTPGGPCAPYLPLRASEGDLTLIGGTGQGLLLVNGDLTLTEGVHFHGLALVRGRLLVEGGASFEGLAVAQGGAEVAADGRVRASACWAVRALEAQRGTLGRLIPVPGVGEIGPL